MRFCEEMARPASVFGPVEWRALARLAVSCASETGATTGLGVSGAGAATGGSGVGVGTGAGAGKQMCIRDSPKTEAGRAISSQNRTTHGLARHNGVFIFLPAEDRNGFEALKVSLAAEHKPTTETESILINGMAESHWLANRAQTLQNTCLTNFCLLYTSRCV